MKPATTLTAYRWIFAVLLVVASAQVLGAAQGRPLHLHATVLALAELVGALMLVWRRTLRVGASLLLVVFAAGVVISTLGHSWPTHLLQYAASTVLIILLDGALGGRRGTAR